MGFHEISWDQATKRAGQRYHLPLFEKDVLLVLSFRGYPNGLISQWNQALPLEFQWRAQSKWACHQLSWYIYPQVPTLWRNYTRRLGKNRIGGMVLISSIWSGKTSFHWWNALTSVTCGAKWEPITTDRYLARARMISPDSPGEWFQCLSVSSCQFGMRVFLCSIFFQGGWNVLNMWPFFWFCVARMNWQWCQGGTMGKSAAKKGECWTCWNKQPETGQHLRARKL